MPNKSILITCGVLISHLILLFTPIYTVDSIETRGGYGDEKINPNEIFFAHYIGPGSSDIFYLGYTDEVIINISWTHPRQVILSIVVNLGNSTVWVGMIQENRSIQIKTGGLTTLKISNYNSYDVDVDGYVKFTPAANQTST